MKKSILAVGLVLGLNTIAHASSNGVIEFNGTIRDTACSIEAAELDQTVSFGDIAKSAINGGGTTPPVNIEIKLRSCSSSTLNSIQTTLTGAAAGFSDAFGVSGVTNAGILIQRNGVTIVPSDSFTQPLN
ncbi:fimbrial protein, partial [Serratia marcescens]|uniref:fimbrial protein n=1 Tax=Serratia marcescens TaxID=615 RepID=UPI0011E873D9